MIFVTVLIGTATWFVLDIIQTKQVQTLLQDQMLETLKNQTIKSRVAFDKNVKSIHQSVKLFVTIHNFIEYINKQNWSPEDSIQIKTNRRSPGWFPKPSLLRTFARPRFAILLDPQNRPRELYQSQQESLPPLLLKPSALLIAKSVGQNLITRIDGVPYVIASERLHSSQGKLLATLMLTSPIDEQFLASSLVSTTAGEVLALLTADKAPIILMSSDHTSVPVGASLNRLQKQYFIIGKEFFDYGSAEEVIKLVSLISASEIQALINSVILSERQLRFIETPVFILTFAIIIFWITRRIRRLTNRVAEFSRKELSGGISISEPEYTGDQLVNLEERFNRLTKEVLEAREIIKEEAQRHTRLIVENAFDSIATVDVNGTIITWNPQAEAMFGWPGKEIIGQKIIDTIIPNKYSGLLNNTSKHILDEGDLQSIRQVEITAHHRDRHEMFIELSVSAVKSENSHLFIVTMHDITERKKTEDKLRKLSHAVEQSPASIVITDLQGRMEYVNPKFTEITGYTFDEVIGKNPSILKSGNQAPEYYKQLWNTITAGKEWSGEFHNKKKNGELFWENASISPLKDASGATTHFIAVKEETTDRKHAEETIQQQLGRMSALRSIDKAITASLDVTLTLDIILSQITLELKIDAAAVLLLNPTTQVLKCIISTGFQSDALQHTQLKLGEGNAGRAALERRILTVPNLRENLDSFSKSELFPDENFISYFAVPLIVKGQVKGILELFHRSYFDPDPNWYEFLEAIAAQSAIAMDNSALFNDLQKSNIELSRAYDTTLEGWAHALDMRDKETEGHSRRVTEMTAQIAQEYYIKDEEMLHLKRGALLHDIGKMAIPDTILLKPGKLTDEEWIIMKQHPIYARDLLFPIEYLRPAIDIPYYHHEKWDGTGYPEGLKGENIPLSARIFAVVDVWDALSSDRPYRPAWSEEKVMEHIRSLAGTHFDSGVVEIFMSMNIRGEKQ
jgi:PAS domain S-box-containing protein